MRAANIVSSDNDHHHLVVCCCLQVRAAEVLFKMVSDLKEYLILNDFTAINDTVSQHSRELHRLQSQTENDLQKLYKDYHQSCLDKK